MRRKPYGKGFVTRVAMLMITMGCAGGLCAQDPEPSAVVDPGVEVVDPVAGSDAPDVDAKEVAAAEEKPCLRCVELERQLSVSIQDAERALSQCRERQVAAEQERDQVLARCRELQEQAAEHERLRQSLTASNAKMAEAYERLKAVHDRQGQEMADAVRKHNELKDSVDQIRAQREALSGTVHELQGQVKDLQARERGLSRSVADLEAARLVWQQERDALDEALTQIRRHPPCHWAMLAAELAASPAHERILALCPSVQAVSETQTHRSGSGDRVVSDRPPASTDPALAVSLTDVGLLLHRAGRLDEAEAYLAWAALILTTAEPRDPGVCATAMGNLGALYLEQQHWEQAVYAYRTALEDGVVLLGKEHPRMADLHNRLAAALRGQKRYDEAEASYFEAIRQYRQAFGNSHPHLIAPINNLAKLYIEVERFEDAAIWLSRARRMMATDEDAAAYRSVVDQTIAELYDRAPEMAEAVDGVVAHDARRSQVVE